jgi:hypothetical protein
MTRAAPPWLEAFQARFGAVLRVPLDRGSGTLTADLRAYDSVTVDATIEGRTMTRAERLAVYNRQYWFRLFGVLHSAFPLVCRLLGYWRFNAHAARYLETHPPRGWDIDDVADAFVAFFERDVDHANAVEREAMIEAARIDAAYRAVFRAPHVEPFRPSAEDSAHLLDAHLVASPAVAILEEHSALTDLRRTTLRDTTERRVAFPPAWPAVRSIALVRAEEATAELPLEPREAELLRLLDSHSVRDALGLLEVACSLEERPGLPPMTQRWLAQSVQRGWWSGMRR